MIKLQRKCTISGFVVYLNLFREKLMSFINITLCKILKHLAIFVEIMIDHTFKTINNI